MATEQAQITSDYQTTKLNCAEERYEDDRDKLINSCSSCKIVKGKVPHLAYKAVIFYKL